MYAHRVKSIVSQNNEVILKNLPFKSGEEVEIIILTAEKKTSKVPYPLRGKPLKYIKPFDPVAADDWEAAN